MDRGIKGSGQGFDAKCVGRLGAHGFIPTHNVPEHQRRDAMLKVCSTLRSLPCGFRLPRCTTLCCGRRMTALIRRVSLYCRVFAASRPYKSVPQAAEARAKRQAVMALGAQRLGGSSDTVKRLTPAQVRQNCLA